jgi:L-2,4-diaminobutyrate decarboxylase
MESGKSSRIYSGASPDQVAADLEPLVRFQEEGLSLAEVKDLVEKHLVPHLGRYELPSFHFLFNSSPEVGAELGAKIAVTHNQGVTNWQVSPGGAVLEELCCRALCDLFGLNPGSDATIMYCGTYANQQAIFLALDRYAERKGFSLAESGVQGFGDTSRLAVLCSADAHFSLKHAVRMLGLGEPCLVPVANDSNCRMDVDALKEKLQEMKEGKQGRGEREVFCIVATTGTTSTGAVDPVPPIADICEQLGAWLHVDGAYGLAYKLVPEWSHLFEGIERAESITWDPHKQMGVPIPSSVLFVRDQADFRRVTLYSSYWNREDATEPNPGVKSIPTTRPMTALPLVTSVRHQGIAGVISRLRAPLAAMRELANYIEIQSDLELCHRPDTGILCFRIVPDGFPREDLDQLQKHVYDTLLSEGQRPVSISQIGGRTVLRLVAISPQVAATDMIETVKRVREIAVGG